MKSTFCSILQPIRRRIGKKEKKKTFPWIIEDLSSD